MKKILLLSALSILAVSTFEPAQAADMAKDIEIKDGAFIPSKIDVPSGEKVKLTIKNSDSVDAEFESTKLNREQIIPAGKSVDVFVGPLGSGSYDFFDDNNPDAVGTITVK